VTIGVSFRFDARMLPLIDEKTQLANQVAESAFWIIAREDLSSSAVRDEVQRIRRVAVYCVRSMERGQVLAALVSRCCSRAREAASGEAERCPYAI